MADDQNDIQAPDIQSAPAPIDPSILSGGQPTAPDVQAPPSSAPDISALTGPAPQPAAPPAFNPNAPSGGPLPQQAPDAAATTPPPPQAAGVQSVWKNIAMGALFGMVGGAGAKTFSGGIAQGGAKVLEQAQLQKDNDVRQQQLKFESLKAADDHIRALDEHSRFDQLTDETKLEIKQKSAEYQAFLQDNFGITPNLSFNDTPADARAAMQNAATANGGTVPPVTTVQQPAPDGQHGTIAGYSPSQQQLQQNQNGFRDAINTSRRIQGLPDMDDRTFQSLGFKGQRDAAQKAIESMKPTPAFNFDKNSGEYLPVVLAQRQQQLETYQNHTDVNGNKDANPAVVKQLQAGIDYLKSAWDTGNKQTNAAAAQETAATTQAKIDTETSPANVAAQAKLEAAKEKATQIASLPYKEAQAKYEQTLKDGDPNAMGALLAQGLIAPSQVISARQPDFAQKAIAAANAYSLKTTGKPYNASISEGYFKAAETPQNVQFFGSAKSLTDQGGTLDQLEVEGKQLPNGKIPSFNKISDWTSAAAGKGPMSAYAQTALGVADDYAKVMGGGTGTDASRQQVLDSFAAAKSPEQLSAAIAAARQAIDSQMSGRIGTNPVMKGMYGDQMLIHVKDPNGKDHTFRSQDQADAFKKQAGIK